MMRKAIWIRVYEVFLGAKRPQQILPLQYQTWFLINTWNFCSNKKKIVRLVCQVNHFFYKGMY